jgi:hypothetical protein
MVSGQEKVENIFLKGIAMSRTKSKAKRERERERGVTGVAELIDIIENADHLCGCHSLGHQNSHLA